MLIPFRNLKAVLFKKGVHISGILHIGAHHCEEQEDYVCEGISSNDITWVEANPSLVEKMNTRGINVYCAAIFDKEEEMTFNIANNGQSSSLLKFGTHIEMYPEITYCDKIIVKTQTLASFIETNNIPIKKRNFWNLDIQGVELNALRSAGEYLKYADAIYTEVNTAEVYKDCSKMSEIDAFLKENGFKRLVARMVKNDNWGDAFYIRV